MALICNGYRFGHNPCRFTGSLTTIYNGRNFRDMCQSGRIRNITAGQGITDDKVGVPMGYRNGGAWIMPQKPGHLSTHNNAIGIATASGTVFWTMTGTAAGTSTATLTGYTVAQASGTAAGTSAVTGALSGTAWCSGATGGTCTVTLTSYATGALAGHIYVNQSEATVTQIVSGVWNAETADYDEAGTTGKALSSAGSAGDPWGTELPGTYTGSEAGAIIGKKLLTTAKFLGLK